MTVAVLGGTGKLGHALALRLAVAGHAVVLGSRDPQRAEAAAAQLAQRTGRPVRGATNAGAAGQAEVVVVAVPAQAQPATLQSVRCAVAGKVVVDCTVCLDPADPSRWAPPDEGSAALRARALLPDARLVSAFHTLSARALAAGDAGPEAGDGLVAADDAEAKAIVMELGRSCGIRCVDCGDLAHAAVLEHLTPLLIGLNRRHRRHSAGVRIVGLE